MNWQTRSIAETRLGEDPENTILVSGHLHDSATGRCICEDCLALESAAGNVAELLRPGESRQIGIEGSPLYLVIKRHQFPPSACRVKDPKKIHNEGRGRGRDGFTLLRR